MIPYLIDPGSKNRRGVIAYTTDMPAVERNRADSLIAGIYGRVSYDLSPVRIQKWKRLFDAGWAYCDSGFYLGTPERYWSLSQALKAQDEIDDKLRRGEQ